MSQDPPEVERWPLGKLILQLRVSTIWSLCIALAGLVAGSFALGMRIDESTQGSQLEDESATLPISAPWQVYADLFPEDSSALTHQSLWGGEWLTSQQGKGPATRRRVWLVVSDDGHVKGVFAGSTGDIPPGALRGLLESNGRQLQGTWRNEMGQGGRFTFNLSRSDDQFSGLYSMDSSEPKDHPSNTWRGWRG